MRELKNAVERSLHRWGDPQEPVDEMVIDPFKSPFEEETSGCLRRPRPAGTTTARAAPPVPFNERVNAIEKQLLQEALAQHGHNQRRTADALGLSYDQLRGLVRKHGLTRHRRRQR